MLHEHSLEDVGGGETIQLSVVDCAHEGGLSRTVGTAQSVALTTGKTEAGIVEQDHTTIGKRELAVAQLLTLRGINLSHLETTFGVDFNEVGVERAVDLCGLGGSNEGLEDG